MANILRSLVVLSALALQVPTGSSETESGYLHDMMSSELDDSATNYARCCLPEHGLSWLRLRQHLWTGLKFASQQAESEEVAGDLAAVREALRGDDMLRASVLEDVRLERLDVRCLLGRVSLQLLHCADGADSLGCAVADVAKIARLVLGLTTTSLSLMDVLTSGWPVHALLKVVLSRHAGVSDLGSGESALQSTLMQIASSEGTGESHTAETRSDLPAKRAAARTVIVEALGQSCVFREPFNKILCDNPGRDDSPRDIQMAAASVALAFAHSEMQRTAAAAARDLATEPSGQVKAEAALATAIVNSDAETHLLEVTRVLWKVADGVVASDTTEAEVLLHELLATTRWPLLGLLASIAALLWAPGRQLLPTASRKAESEKLPHGVCSCTLTAWPVRDAISIDAALNVLKKLRHAEDDPNRLMEIALSDEAQKACPELPLSGVVRINESNAPADHNVSSLPPPNAFRETAYQVLKGLEMQSPADEKFDQPFVMRRAQELRYAQPEHFDINVCVPGAQALAMVCALTALAQNRLQYAITYFSESSLFAMALLPCVIGREGRAQFASDGWGDLTPWHHPSLQHFMEHIFEPLLSSDKWWRGEGTFENLHDQEHASQPLSHNACAGIPDIDANHPCHAAARGGGANLVLSRGITRVPLTKILGVGLMKAGSTAVWQALGAALQFPMGFDCMSISATARWRVALRKEPISHVLEQCSEELFKWELAKDPALTPLASRLSVAWPAVSAHGERLRLYFLVRNPFSWLRSFVKHLTLAVSGPDAEVQRFSVDNLPQPSLFTREKQLFLDVQKSGLRYTGYLDAAIQGWALLVDEYLRCPHLYALIRYEDFIANPLAVIEGLVRDLGFASLWSDAAAEAVREAVSFQYQRTKHQHHAQTQNFEALYGPRLYARIYEAVARRVSMLGYVLSDLGPEPDLEARRTDPIDVPAPPELGQSIGCHA